MLKIIAGGDNDQRWGFSAVEWSSLSGDTRLGVGGDGDRSWL